jgi:predicted transcriptional regulator YheO
VEVADAVPGDVPLVWDGAAVAFVRLGSPPPAQGAEAVPSADLSDGLARLIAEVEAELGGPLSSLGRPEKQRAVRLLEERGAFEMRRSAETVAEALGVTRFTVYNYLNRGRDPRA